VYLLGAGAERAPHHTSDTCHLWYAGITVYGITALWYYCFMALLLYGILVLWFYCKTAYHKFRFITALFAADVSFSKSTQRTE
jgi:hypothetical protein